MPGRIMEDASMNGSHMNHEKGKHLNGVNGAFNGGMASTEKGKVRPQPAATTVNSIEKMTRNENNDEAMRDSTIPQTNSDEGVSKDSMSQLPPELLQLTEAFYPLSRLLMRVADHTHNAMESTIHELARLPLPSSAVNGNSAHSSNAGDDNSFENVEKKMKLLNFAKDAHTKFTKALVLTDWSKRSEDISKVIELNNHLTNQRRVFNNGFATLFEMKRDMVYLRVRKPDLNTAVEVLSTGQCSWMPDLNYKESPLLTAEEILKTLKNLNSLLSLRINLHEHDRLPVQFKNFSINSGRVTFHVAGEFELDLTIGDESPETQFWFINFRFGFSPTISQIPDALLAKLEQTVNFLLSQDNPWGACYKYLHELVLTHKISEIKKQAYELSQGKWVDTLVVEPLQRALCIQYWSNRYAGVKGPKSWIIIGVNSGKRKDGKVNPNATSSIGLRWFRDAKEVKDIDIPVDLDHISTEALLTTVISLHIEHILTCTHAKLKEVPLYKNRDLGLELSISSEEPIESVIRLQATHNETLTVAIESITGRITLSPASTSSIKAEAHLNNHMTDPVNEMHNILMNARPNFVVPEILRRSVSTGWDIAPNPGLILNDIRSVLRKDTQLPVWLKKKGWKPELYLAIGISTSGEEWKLVETSGLKRPAPGPSRVRGLDISTVKVSWSCPMPMSESSPLTSYEFFGTLQIYAASQLSQSVDISTMHTAGIKHHIQDKVASVNTSSIRVPRLLIQLQDLTESSIENASMETHQDEGERSLWAKDMVSLTFSGVEFAESSKIDPSPSRAPLIPPNSGTPVVNPPLVAHVVSEPHVEGTYMTINHASVIVPSCKDLELLGMHVDNDIMFDSKTGTFMIKIKTPFGQSCIPALKTRLRDVERLVEFVKVMNDQKSRYTCQSVSLNKIMFTYMSEDFVANDKGVVVKPKEPNNAVTYRASVDVESAPTSKATVRFEVGNPHIRMEDMFNENLRKYGLASLLNSLTGTLALLTVCDTVEKSWFDLVEKATVSISVRSLTECHLIYRFKNPTKQGNPSTNGKDKVVRLEVKHNLKGVQAYWLVKRVYRMDEDLTPDAVDEVLKGIWSKIGVDVHKPWIGLQTCAAAELPAIGSLLLALNKALKSYTDNKENLDTAKSKETSRVGNNANEQVQIQAPTTASASGAAGSGSRQQQLPPQHHQPQQRSGGIAPQAPMMAPQPNMVRRQIHPQQIMQMSEPQRQAFISSLPEAQRLVVMNLFRQHAQQQAQAQARREQLQRQGQGHEVIELDD